MGSMSEGSILIVSPALASSNNGNWHTASRWRTFLSAFAPTEIIQQWDGEPARALVALHARRSAQSIARFREVHPNRPIALVLTGTDVYGEMASDDSARQSLRCATHLVVLQAEALNRLEPADCAKARVIVQSAPVVLCADRQVQRVDYVAVGHLRSEKDPLALMQAARLLLGTGIQIVHVGEALDPALGAEARRTMDQCPNYRWLGNLPQPEARRRIACARALVHMSRLEGGANVVIEAVRSQVPVLASRIDGNVGLLGRDYDGYFSCGSAVELAQLMQRMLDEPSFAERLQAQGAVREALFEPAAEAAAVQALLSDMLRESA
jgi:putative glycosyltransferase (TIGR04348 family)